LIWILFFKNKVGTQNNKKNKKNLLGNELLDSEFIKLVIWLVFCHELVIFLSQNKCIGLSNVFLQKKNIIIN